MPLSAAELLAAVDYSAAPLPLLPLARPGMAAGMAAGVDDAIDTAELIAQLDSESHSLEEAVQHYRELGRDLRNVGKAASLQPSQRLIATWFNPLVEVRCSLSLRLSLSLSVSVCVCVCALQFLY